MAFNFISLELLCVVVIILVYTRFRKTTIFSLAMVEGLKVYHAPKKEDFATLVDSLTPVNVRENSKGKKNKFDVRAAKKNQAPAKIPLR